MSLPRHPWLAGVGLVGLAVLAVSLVSARHFLHGPSSGSSGEPPPARTGGVRSLGTVDVESGLVPLAPVQPGEIIEVPVKEGQNVQKGELLLKLDDTLAQAQLKQAQAAVREAQAKMAEAQQGVQAHQHMVEAQKAKIEARRKELDAARAR